MANPTPPPRRRPYGGILIALSIVLFALTLGLAFTVYGIVAMFLGVACFAAGLAMLAKRPTPGTDGP